MSRPREFGNDPLRAILGYVLLAGVLALVVGLPVASAWQRRPVTIEELTTLDLFTAHAAMALFLAAWFALQRGASLRDFLAIPGGPWRPRATAGIRLGVLAWVLTIGAMALVAPAVDPAETGPSDDFVAFATWLASRPLPLRVALVITAMTVEEAFFRAFLQPRFGLLVATLGFALGHVGYGSLRMSIGVLIVGLVLGLDFRHRADVIVCAIAHGVFDAVQLLVVLPLVASQL